MRPIKSMGVRLLKTLVYIARVFRSDIGLRIVNW